MAGRQPPGHHQTAQDIATSRFAANWPGCCPETISRRIETRCWGRLSEADAPAGLVARLARITADPPFASTHEVMVAFGINEPERRPR